MTDTQLTYTRRDWTVAAQTLGDQVRICMAVLAQLPDGPEPHFEYRRVANLELERFTISLAREAAHAAGLALETDGFKCLFCGDEACQHIAR